MRLLTVQKGNSVDTVGEMPYTEDRYAMNDNRDLGLRGEKKDMPTSAAEWSDFNRAFSNKTRDIEHGTEKLIAITTSNDIYLVSADGYMNGFAEAKLPINYDIKTTLREWSEFSNAVDASAKNIDNKTKQIGSSGRRTGSYIRNASNQRSASSDVELFNYESEGIRAGYLEGNGQDFEDYQIDIFGDLTPGSFVFDGENGYKVNEDGLLIKVEDDNVTETSYETEKQGPL